MMANQRMKMLAMGLINLMLFSGVVWARNQPNLPSPDESSPQKNIAANQVVGRADEIDKNAVRLDAFNGVISPLSRPDIAQQDRKKGFLNEDQDMRMNPADNPFKVIEMPVPAAVAVVRKVEVLPMSQQPNHDHFMNPHIQNPADLRKIAMEDAIKAVQNMPLPLSQQAVVRHEFLHPEAMSPKAAAMQEMRLALERQRQDLDLDLRKNREVVTGRRPVEDMNPRRW